MVTSVEILPGRGTVKQNLSESIEAYIAHRNSRGLSAHTIKNDKRVLRHFLTATGNIWVHNIHEGHVDAHFVKASEVRKPESLKVDHNVLSGFFQWAVRTRRTGRFDDPMAHRPRPKFTKREWRGIPLAKFPALLDSADDPRDRILLAKGIYLLGRAAELTGIRLEQVDLDGGWVHYRRPKVHKTDNLPISLELDRELRQWLTYYSEQCGSLQSHWFLIPARKPHLLSNGRVVPGSSRLNPERELGTPHRIVKRALKAIDFPITNPDGSPRNEGVHTLRRSGARAFYEELSNEGHPHPVGVVQSLLGHASEKQTREYIGAEADREKRDDRIRGKLMYPSLAGGNVTGIRRSRDTGPEGVQEERVNVDGEEGRAVL